MAQNYRDGLGRKVDTDSEVRSGRRLGGSNYARESVQDRKDSLQEQVCKPENIAREERKTDYPGTEPGHEVYFGKENPAIGKIAVEKVASDSGPKVDVEDRSVERRCDFHKAEVEAGMRALEQDVGVDNLQQQSPYVQHNSKLDYKDGREGYGPEQERPLGADEQKSEPMREASEENVLAPFHKPQSVEDEKQHRHHLQSNDPPKSPTFVEKIKDMLTSKPQTEATTNNIVDGEVTTNIAGGHGDEQPTSESSKKGVLEKIKEKLSQSP